MGPCPSLALPCPGLDDLEQVTEFCFLSGKMMYLIHLIVLRIK